MKATPVPLLLLAAALSLHAAAPDRRLRVEIMPRSHGAPLAFDVLTNLGPAGQSLSVTRLDFLLSNFAVRRPDGVWAKQTNQAAFISARAGLTRFALEDLPPGPFDRLRFSVGLSPDVNHSDSAVYPAGHPLNPLVNGLHWGWTGGYVFLALEGAWLEPDGRQSGYSYHLANDPSLMSVELPVNAQPGGALRLVLNVDDLFADNIDDSNSSTHSRTNDALAGQLVKNVERAFAVEPGPIQALPKPSPSTVARMDMASNATPYRLTFSAFFPRPDLPRDNPLTGEGVVLGGKLFFDPRLSADDSESCARCHHPRSAFVENRRFSRGVDGYLGDRTAMPLLNLAWKKSYFWDGRAAALREQVLQPIQNPVEMHASLPAVVAKLSADKNYRRYFAGAFGSPEVTSDRIARALEQFLLAQVSFDSKFDRVLNRAATFTGEEQRGFELFNTEYDPRHGQFGADCFHCHGGPLLQSQPFANNGLDARFRDLGRYKFTKQDGDKGKFSVPSLRNVAVTAPYMHDGRFATLEQVVEHYCTGVKRSATLDPNLAKHPDRGVPLNEADKKALVAFLRTLTDQRFLRPE